MMPHIMSDQEYRVYQAYKATGLTPEQVMSLIPEDAPMPLNLYTDDMNHAMYPTPKEYVE